MKAYNKGKCLFGTLTLDDLGVTQGEGQNCNIFTVQAFIYIHCSSLYNHLESS